MKTNLTNEKLEIIGEMAGKAGDAIQLKREMSGTNGHMGKLLFSPQTIKILLTLWMDKQFKIPSR